MENKINQHYVWQHYLKSWTVNGDIFCLQDHKKIFPTSTRNVASQRYFYSIDKLTLNDCKIIREAFINKTNPYAQKMLLGWIQPVEFAIWLKEIFANLIDRNEEIGAEVNLFFKTQLEELYSRIETAAIPGLTFLQSGKVDFLYGEDDTTDIDIDFIIFLCYQYFRTKKMKNAIIENLSGMPGNVFNDIGQAFNIIALILGTQVGYEISEGISNQKYSCNLLYNATSIPFITGDQPIVNTYATNDPKSAPKDLELYYPITPQTALLISPHISCGFSCTEQDVRKYNDLINDQSLEKLFSVERSQLEVYLEK